ncbi:MAG: hypothetical protein H6Q20_1382 [Bacteroidetes bacterium]|jgi:uncharacterized membrane protein YjjB (DUF3815 family)|nr:hypothetical protein [Bacteroidota bacterium]
MNIALDILSDGFFAAIAAIGFGAISDPPMRAFKFIALLAAIGHACRFCLMSYAGMDIAASSFISALIIGFGSLWLGGKIYCPMTVIYIPALLPMIPGKFAYNTVFSQIMFLQNMKVPELKAKYMEMFFSNGMVTITVIFLLAIGATIPMFIFHSKAFSLTRHINK